MGFRKNRCQTKSLIIDGVQICESKGKADVISEEFEKYHKVSLNNTLSEEHNVHEYLENFNKQSSIIVEHKSFTNIVELKFFISRMKNKKSPVLDEVKDNSIIKNE